MSDLEDQVLTSLRRIIRATHLHSRKLEKQTGLTTPQLVIIQTVSALYDPTVSAIAHAASLSLATVTTILNRLERNGLVMRSPRTRGCGAAPCRDRAGRRGRELGR